MLDDLELSLVQRVQTREDRALARQDGPGLDGAIFQNMGRRATVVELSGVLTGAEVGDGLTRLREKFHAREPAVFSADIAAGTQVAEVLIEDLRVRELAGKSERFEYRIVLREIIPPPPPAAEVSADGLGPFEELVDSIDAMGSLPDFRDPTPPLLDLLDGFQEATEGLDGVLGALNESIGTP